VLRARLYALTLQLLLCTVILTLIKRQFDLGANITLVRWGGICSFIFLIAFWYLALNNRPRQSEIRRHRSQSQGKSRRLTRAQLAGLRVAVVIATYNESRQTLKDCLGSLAAQTKLPDVIYLIDDGSHQPEDVRAALMESGLIDKVPIQLIRQTNAGKRLAQSQAFAHDQQADIFVTLDSDTVLDPNAVAELVNGYADPEVTSVGGIILGVNPRHNLLTRLIDVGFVSSYLSGRAAWSSLGSVVVHSGAIASYRAEIVRRHLPFYARQRVFGQEVASGDDRMLTTLALLHGKSITQESAIAFTPHPENLRDLTRQRLRWSRSFYWGGFWLIRHMPLTRLSWWLVASQFTMFAVNIVLIPVLFAYWAIALHALPFELLVYLAVISYLRTSRYAMVMPVLRPKDKFFYLGSYLISPIAGFLNFYLSWVINVLGLLTIRRTCRWGERISVSDREQPSDIALVSA